jgi:uncharacterized protein (UPF0332 family)
MLPDNAPVALASVRLMQARECLQSAELEIAAKIYRSAANRSYYSIFHAMRALLALDEFDSKKHSGIIAAFRQRYIRTKIFPANYSDIVGNAFDVRIDSDYEDFYLISKDEVAAQIENAKTFLTAVEEYLAPKLQDVSEKTET